MGHVVQEIVVVVVAQQVNVELLALLVLFLGIRAIVEYVAPLVVRLGIAEVMDVDERVIVVQERRVAVAPVCQPLVIQVVRQIIVGAMDVVAVVLVPEPNLA